MLGFDDLTLEQNEAIDWLQHRTEALLAYPVGFGKTIICLTAISNIRKVYGPWRTLLVSTKSICEHTWQDEISGWSHLPPLSYASASGRNLVAAQAEADITAINFESLEWYFDQIDEGLVDLPSILVIDESSKMKAHDSNRVTRLAGLRRTMKSGKSRSYKTQPGYTHRFKRRFLLSATPTPEGYQGLWAQEACMSARRRLGANITSFRDQYCTRDRSGFGWEVLSSSEPLIEEKLKHVMHLPEAKDFLGLPEPTHSRIIIPWEPEAREQYDEMERELELSLASLDPSTLVDELEVVAPNAGVLLTKLRQLCSGFLYSADGAALQTAHSAAKLDALEALQDRSGGAPLLIFTQYRAEMEAIAERHPEAQVGLPETLQGWSQRKIPMMILHPASAGHGLNLQYGTNICLYYSLPFSYEQWAQSWGRIHRRGQTRPCSILRFERPNSVDQDVWHKLQGKNRKLVNFLDHMRDRRRAA